MKSFHTRYQFKAYKFYKKIVELSSSQGYINATFCSFVTRFYSHYSFVSALLCSCYPIFQQSSQCIRGLLNFRNKLDQNTSKRNSTVFVLFICLFRFVV